MVGRRTKYSLMLGVLTALVFFLTPATLNLTSGPGLLEVSAQNVVPEGEHVLPAIKRANETKAGDNSSAFSPAEAARNLGLADANALIFSVLSSLGFFVAYIGGNMLDVSAGLFTIHMAGMVEHFNLDVSIEATWGIIRDLLNLFFIFGLILVGFQLILGVNESNSRKTLGTIVIAALLINFSLYATQLLVDFSNVLSYQISGLMDTDVRGELWDKSYPKLSDGFTRLSGVKSSTEKESLSGITGNGEVPIFTNIDNGGISGLATAFMLGFLFLIFYMLLGFVFIAGALILFTRFIALIVLMIFSPIFFIGMVMPYFKSLGDTWQKHFVSNLIVGPAYLFMLYVSYRSLNGLGSQSGEFSFIGFIFQLLIVVAFLLASLAVAKKAGSFGANQAIGITKSSAGLMTRNSLGRIADNWDRGMEKKGVAENSLRRRLAGSLAGNKFGSSYSRKEDRAAKEKADQKKARYQSIYGDNKANKPGIVGTIKTGHQSDAGADERIAMEKAVTGATNEQLIEILSSHKPGSAEYEAVVQHMSDTQFKAVMKAKPEELNDEAIADIKGKRQKHVRSITRDGIQGATKAQLQTLDTQDIIDQAADLKQSQFDDIMKDEENYSKTQRENIAKARKDQFMARFTKDPESVFKDRKGKDVAKLPTDILVDERAYPHLTSDALSGILDEQNIPPETRREMAKNIVKANANPDTVDFIRNNPKGRQFAAGAQLPPDPKGLKKIRTEKVERAEKKRRESKEPSSEEVASPERQEAEKAFSEKFNPPGKTS